MLALPARATRRDARMPTPRGERGTAHLALARSCPGHETARRQRGPPRGLAPRPATRKRSADDLASPPWPSRARDRVARRPSGEAQAVTCDVLAASRPPRQGKARETRACPARLLSRRRPRRAKRDVGRGGRQVPRPRVADERHDTSSRHGSSRPSLPGGRGRRDTPWRCCPARALLARLFPKLLAGLLAGLSQDLLPALLAGSSQGLLRGLVPWLLPWLLPG